LCNKRNIKLQIIVARNGFIASDGSEEFEEFLDDIELVCFPFFSYRNMVVSLHLDGNYLGFERIQSRGFHIKDDQIGSWFWATIRF